MSNMKKALLIRITGVLVLALFISSFITYYAVGHQLLDSNITTLSETLKVIDYAIDYQDNLQEQIISLHKISFDDDTRITIIDKNGIVYADTSTKEIEGLENHIQREEIQEALREGDGSATRYSQTVEKNLLYVAKLSYDTNYILRISVPYKGISDFIYMVIPFLLLGIGIAFIVSWAVAVQFTNAITSPLHEISSKMEKMKDNDFEFIPRNYRYEELTIISDTTLRLTKELRAHVNKLEKEKKIRQEFFSNASHELKTPITSIKGYTELLEAGFVQDEPTKRDFMQRILKETENMTSLINDILMISQLEANEAIVTISKVRMSPLVKEIFESLEPIALENKITLHQECEPIIMEASPKQLRELLMNLISNGIKYNQPGGNVWVQVRKQEEQIVIQVRDDGMGIAKVHQPRIFERFYRVDKGRSKKVGGTGLGLSIVKHIVEYYQGTLMVESEPQQGSLFTVCLPINTNDIVQNI